MLRDEINLCLYKISYCHRGKLSPPICFTLHLLVFCRVSVDLPSTICCGMTTIRWQQMTLSSLRITCVTCFHGAHAACPTQHQPTTHIWLRIELVSTWRGECAVVVMKWTEVRNVQITVAAIQMLQCWHFESKWGWSLNCGREIKGYDTKCYVSEAFTYKRNACAWHCKVGLFRNFDDEYDNRVLLPQHPVQ
jgi:hypothetical protein